MLVGVVDPDLGTFLLLLVPAQDFVPEEVIRLVMLVGALVVPGVVGLVTLALSSERRAQRRDDPEAVAPRLPAHRAARRPAVFLAGLAIWRKGHSLARAGPTLMSRSWSSPAPTTRSPPTSTVR